MPIYMDVHIVPGVHAKGVAEAHHQDLLHQEEFGCKCMTYWIDEHRGNVFCLIEAPEKEAVEEMHRRAHGLIPNKIIEVNNTVVESFLGRIYDPEEAQITEDGLKVFHDPSYRILLVTKTIDSVVLRYQLGVDTANELLTRYNQTIRKNIREYNGREVEQEGYNFIISFTSASKAVACALSVQNDMQQADVSVLHFRMSINAGEPVENSNRIFGDALQFASVLCHVAEPCKIAIASHVKELIAKDVSLSATKNLFCLTPNDESLLTLFFSILEQHWQNSEFDMEKYCHAVAMSTSQLYRKTISLTGLSPNLLLKEFRLEKAKELLKKQRFSIAQITYDAGFTSASYFTKCFKNKYGLLPMAYLDLLH